MEDHFAQFPGQVTLGDAIAVASGKPERAISFTFGVADKPSKNRDIVLRSELEPVAERLRTQGIDLLHSFPDCVGAFASEVKFIPEGERVFFGGDGRLWEWRYPQEVAAIAAAHRDGTLEGSMEMGFGWAECDICHERFPGNSDYPDFYRHCDRKHQGNGNRILHEPDPRGAALLFSNIQRGAFEGTRVLALASKRREGASMPDEEKDGQAKKTGGTDDGKAIVDVVALAADMAELRKANKQFEEQIAAITKDRDTAMEEAKTHKAAIDDMSAKAAIAAQEGERVEKFGAALSEKHKDAKLTEEQMTRLRERARTMPDEGWQAFTSDFLVAYSPPSQTVATAGRRKAGFQPPGSPPHKDDSDKDKPRFAALGKVMSGRYGEGAHVAVASRKDEAEDDPDGGDDDA